MTDTRTPIRERVDEAAKAWRKAAYEFQIDIYDPEKTLEPWGRLLRSANEMEGLARELLADAEQAHAVPELPEVGPGSTSYELGRVQVQMLQTYGLIRDALRDIDEVMLSLCDATDRVGVWRRNVLRDARKALRAALELGGG